MIRLYRDRVKAPEVFASADMQEERERLSRFYGVVPNERAQRTFKPSTRLQKLCVNGLMQLSHGKCAYCETPLRGESSVHADSFRPSADAINLDGTVSHDHYWWLTYEWSNALPACAACNRLKGRRFPVSESRAPFLASGAALRDEGPLLIDPCEDEPSDHLVFSEDGFVAGRTEQGRITIEVLGLNRETLAALRREALGELRKALALLVTAIDPAEQLRSLSGDAWPFAGARRQFITPWLADLRARVPGFDTDASLVGVQAPFDAGISDEERQDRFQKFAAQQTRQEAFSIEREDLKEDYYIRTRSIERIEIENFRPIEHLELRFSDSEGALGASTEQQAEDAASRQAPWLMLLGENGVGKSSALQAVALAMLGDEWRRRADLDARRFLRIGSERGYVRVFLTGVREPIELTFSRDSSRFSANHGEPKALILGYGSTRLLPRAGLTVESAYEFAHSDNLFNPFVPLGDAAAWLLRLDDESFDRAARALKILLELGDEDRLVRERQPVARVEAEINGTRLALEELSDGYQSVLALTCDVMRVMLTRWPTMEVAEGIVILDEIGSHLHPRWRMRVVRSMRRTFPRAQFLASTHDPLCLRGLDNGEVAVMRRNAKNQVIAITDGLPSPRGMRVDQLLTSEFFGMNSTIDPDLEVLFAEYYRLLSWRDRQPAEEQRVNELRELLDRHRVLGATRRERLMLEVIDRYLAEEPDISDEELRQLLTDETKAKVREIWDSVDLPSSAPRKKGRRRKSEPGQTQEM